MRQKELLQKEMLQKEKLRRKVQQKKMQRIKKQQKQMQRHQNTRNESELYSGQKGIQHKWKLVLLLISLIFFGVCVVVLGQYFIQSIREKRTMNNFKKELEAGAEARLGEEQTTPENGWAAEDEKAMLQLKLAWAKNADVTAWLTIPDTQIDYPLMYTPDAPDYYLNHDVRKQNAVSGAPYLDERCDLETGDRLIAYGHNMKDGSMFADLLSFEKEDFRQEHSLIRLVLPEEVREYEVIQAFRLDAQSGVDLLTYEVEEEAPLLILCTCEYSHLDGRFVVVGKLVK